MQTLKTALVVVALLAVLFVAYQYLNHQRIGIPLELGGDPWNAPPEAPPTPSGVNVEAPPVEGFDPLQGSSVPAPMASQFPNAPAVVSAPGGTPPSAASDSAVEGPSANVAPAGGSLAGSFGAAAPATYVAPELSVPIVAEPSPSVSGPPGAGPASSSEDPSGVHTFPPAQPSATPPDNTSSEAGDGLARFTSPAVAKYAFEQAWSKAELQTNDGQLARALLTLSEFYRSPDLDDALQTKLVERLDQLAGTVIYSTRHLLEEPYKARRGETLADIAKPYGVSVRLLQNINSVRDPELVLPGSELKVLRGPFRAVVDLSRSELTVFLGGLYAGRFTFQAGADPAPRAGTYEVLDIQPGRAYYSSSGQSVPAGHPSNPYGQWWIDLGSEMCIHGSPDAGDASQAGCVGLAPRDAADVAAILSIGSTVVVR